MAESIVSDVVVKVLEFMARSAVEEIAPYFGGRRNLKELEQTMKFIRARIVDAERRGEGEEADGALIREWLKSLKKVVYRLEDLFEEVDFIGKENQQQLPRGRRGNYKLPKCLCILFSRWSSPLKINKRVAEEGKAIMEELEGIKSNMDRLNFREINTPVRVRPVVNRNDNDRETWSHVREGTIIGRDEDKKRIVEVLLDANVINDHVVWERNKNVLIIPIVGIGGLGKTALAQLVFNDRNVQKHFELKAWACISEISSLEEYARKILKSIEPGDYIQLTLEQIQTRLREAVQNKKYLLVLDDVWDEDRDRWFRLEGLLCGGKQGSRIIVTSRSMVVAKNMGTVEPYVLRDLSEESSWALFKSLAFKEGQEERMPELTSIGREIVKKCANVPLAIRAIGGLLYCKDTVQEWRLFKGNDLMMLEQQRGGAHVMSTLKLSYDHLEPHLKQCLSYCSLFPKDYEFDKDDLIYHWMAQGYVESPDGDHASPEDVGHGYFMELLRRSFFQDFKRDKFIYFSFWCKMHDLMNDLARKVAGDGCLFLDEHTYKHIKGTAAWHVSVDESVAEIPSWLITAKGIRSLRLNGILLKPTFNRIINENFSGLRCLRTLDLRVVELDNLPDAVGDLKHLRYLRLWGMMEYLPESITRLRNLLTLDLRGCLILQELPTSFNKLINLRHLLLQCENHLFEMPPGFGELTSLRRLSLFNVGKVNGLDALTNMNDLSGDLFIRFRNLCRANAVSEAKEANLKGKKVICLELNWGSSGEAEEASEEEEDRVLEWLQPPPTLEFLRVRNWRGRRFPSWGMEEDDKQLPSHSCSQLPNLVELHIRRGNNCQHLPPFSTLPRLRVLVLVQLNALEYIESGGPEAVLPSSSSSYFPSLETLELWGLHELKGWSKQYSPLRCFYLPNLISLEIRECPKLMSMPPLVATRLESLKVYNIHAKLLKDLLSAPATALEESTSTTSRPTLSSLKRLEIHSVDEGFESLSINLPSLENFKIWGCPELINIAVDCPTPLRQLYFRNCEKLRDKSGALKHLYPFMEVVNCPGLEEDMRYLMWKKASRTKCFFFFFFFFFSPLPLLLCRTLLLE